MSADVLQYWDPLKKDLDASGDLEEQINILRKFPRARRLEIQEKDINGKISLPELFAELTALAEAVLRGSCEITRAELSRRQMEPEGGFAIVAMGKFGGHELTYRSDLDIIYLYDLPEDQDYFTRLGTRIISVLTILTAEGIAYQIDTALRPSGNAGTLVSSLDSFREYHQKQGRTWERQALLRARIVLGPVDFAKKVTACFDGIVYQDSNERKLAGEIDHLRGRMEREIAKEKVGRYNIKTGRGGIVDIEFATQFLQLLHGLKHPNVRNQNTLLALESLKREKILAPSLADSMEKAYLFLRLLETRIRLHLDHPSDDLIEGAEWLTGLENRFFGGQPVIPRYLETRETVRGLYERIVIDAGHSCV